MSHGFGLEYLTLLNIYATQEPYIFNTTLNKFQRDFHKNRKIIISKVFLLTYISHTKGWFHFDISIYAYIVPQLGSSTTSFSLIPPLLKMSLTRFNVLFIH
jgi:hypothetical protein